MAARVKTDDVVAEARMITLSYGEGAGLHAAMKVDEAMEKMDIPAYRHWLAVLDCVERLDFDREGTAH